MRALDVDPADAAPIWRQIEDGMRRLVVSGRLVAGQVVPSVRELARELRVNPATVSKAYQRLTDAGVLVVRRGEGTFVAEREVETVARDRRGLLVDAADRFAWIARSVGATTAEAIEALRNAWERAGETNEGGQP
jgi:GntR family transcriptional regulator